MPSQIVSTAVGETTISAGNNPPASPITTAIEGIGEYVSSSPGDDSPMCPCPSAPIGTENEDLNSQNLQRKAAPDDWAEQRPKSLSLDPKRTSCSIPPPNHQEETQSGPPTTMQELVTGLALWNTTSNSNDCVAEKHVMPRNGKIRSRLSHSSRYMDTKTDMEIDAAYSTNSSYSTWVPKQKPKSAIKSDQDSLASNAVRPAVQIPALSLEKFGLIYEELSSDPFQVLVAAVIAWDLPVRDPESTACHVVNIVVKKFPRPTDFAIANLGPAVRSSGWTERGELVELLKCLPRGADRAKTLAALAKVWISDELRPALETRAYPGEEKWERFLGRVYQEDMDFKIHDSDKETSFWGDWVSGYARDCFRIFFCDDWQKVLPRHADLDAYLKWRWLRKGLDLNHVTGEIKPASTDHVRLATKSAPMKSRSKSQHRKLATDSHRQSLSSNNGRDSQSDASSSPYQAAPNLRSRKVTSEDYVSRNKGLFINQEGRQHMIYMAENGTQKVQCDLCKDTFAKGSGFTYHLKFCRKRPRQEEGLLAGPSTSTLAGLPAARALHSLHSPSDPKTVPPPCLDAGHADRPVTAQPNRSTPAKRATTIQIPPPYLVTPGPLSLCGEDMSSILEPRRRKKASSSSSKEKDRDGEEPRRRKKTSKDPDNPTRERTRKSASRTSHSSRKMSIVPEMERREALSSPYGSKTSLPYPSFSKEHSKEAVHSKENVADPRKSPFTPNPTDLSQDAQDKDEREETQPPAPNRAPPSPPLTATDAGPELRRPGSGSSIRMAAHTGHHDPESGRRSADSSSRLTPGSGPKFSASRSSLRQSTETDDATDITSTTERSRTSTIKQDNAAQLAPPAARPISPNTRPPGRTASAGSHSVSVVTQSTDSDATSIAPTQRAPSRPTPLSTTESSPSVGDSSPRTPTPRDADFPYGTTEKTNPMIEIFNDPLSRPQSVDSMYMDSPLTPPPPPPPPVMNADAPRVDYLLQHGGLPHPVPRSLLSAVATSSPVSAYQQYTSPRVPASQNTDVRSIFAPFQNLLESYNQVISKHGSIAVATGYRSVARRLLDRLEAVFARNISSESCQCIMCLPLAMQAPTDEETGVSWGEILEYVSGRRELPPWPPFSIAASGLGIADMEQEAPMQKLDIDVPEEYREHYVRQSKKTKTAVQKWLSAQPEEAASPPQEVDDETLLFAMLTHLEPQKRPLFTALYKGMSTLPASRAQTPLAKVSTEVLAKTSLALQRLYRLERPPRDPECTMYLLKNPEIHGVLATLAAVSAGEWEILVSGRFDGFLWSGAENAFPSFGTPMSRGPSRGPTPLSRTTTPFSVAGIPSRGPSRGPTPFSPNRDMTGTPAASSFGAPVQMDEETEIAVLAEVEREIYLGMETLENAFEALHCKAETVRRNLRERSAGLAMAAQARRGSMTDGIEVRLGTPASAAGWGGWESETDDGIDDWRSEIAPDDSASNISFSRRRRPERRHERRTPAPVEEEDESEVTPEVVQRR
ncbi:uncharacterized protein BDZ99DRAFT_476700 [Mytilinidion resinicola]|uniref:Uncharacterized protein n=1 Tax=Mytilinidion resinicola TaxID=574789 RepID=A0A6A6YNU9_9PEZI|nr:uncharacterized protein BDZ99DRAFT_476700 [Mytilinidion resinicola]KAF2810552.1 hypothetical protein BDZ99DRAFT_476700 [Mytilinidion resinicola]